VRGDGSIREGDGYLAGGGGEGGIGVCGCRQILIGW
jgi:hypothetical protein